MSRSWSSAEACRCRWAEPGVLESFAGGRWRHRSFIHLRNKNSDLDAVRAAELAMLVEGTDGFRMEGPSGMPGISRDLVDLVR